MASCLSLEWAAKVAEHASAAAKAARCALPICNSAIAGPSRDEFDVIVTDPPYYDAIPYSDLMDFFYVWLRRTLHGSSPDIDASFSTPLVAKVGP